MGVKNGGAATKIGKNIHFLLIIGMSILQKVGLTTWRIRLFPKKETAKNNIQKIFAINAEFV